MKDMRSHLIIFFIAGAFPLLSCDGLFPTQNKETVPSDHTVKIKGVLHAPGLTDPLFSGGCFNCHGYHDLHGGVTVRQGQRIFCPSCYECHGAVWEGVNGGTDD
jgi:hypothetical protein